MLDTDGRGILFLKDFKEKLGKKIAMQVYSSLVARASSEINGITLKLFKELLLSSSS